MEAILTRAVLIADTDLGFVWWLGQALHNAGYLALPAKSIEDATALLTQLNLEIDLLIVSYSFEGASAFADNVRRVQGHLRVIAVIDAGDEAGSPFPGADTTEVKPLNADHRSVLQWLQTIDRVLEPSGSKQNRRARVSKAPGGGPVVVEGC